MRILVVWRKMITFAAYLLYIAIKLIIMWMILFFVLPLAGLAYVSWHVYALLPLPTVWRWAVVVAGWLAFLCVFANFSHGIDRMPMGLATAFYETGFSSIFVLLYLVLLFLLLDLGRLLRLVPKSWLYANGVTSVGIVLLMVSLFTYAYFHYRHKERQTLELPTAKRLTKDVKLVLMSDLHLGYHNRRQELARWVDMVNAERPDLILIAGDIIDMSLRPLMEEDMASELRRLKAPVYACLGNHEYYSGEPRALEFYREAGIHLLRDSVATVGELQIVGRDDRSNPRRKSVKALLSGTDQRRYTILLDHQPYHLEQAERAGVDFQFSGHTHHGQLWPISWITESVYECAYGPWRRGDTRYYVSSGMGIWGAKFRVGTCSEYIVARIKAGGR